MNRVKFRYMLCALLFVVGVLSLAACYTDKVEKVRIVLINSYEKSHMGYGNFKEDLHKKLRNLGIEAEIDVLYLNCNAYGEFQEIASMRRLLNSLNPKDVDLILMVNDQAAYSGLKSNHPILKQIPLILVNINYPNYDALAPYVNDSVYVLRDTPSFKNNIEFIKALHGNQYVNIVYNIDLTFLGNISMQNLQKSIDNEHIRMAIHPQVLVNDSMYEKLNDLSVKMNFRKLIPNDPKDLPKDFMIHVSPFRYMNGLSLLNLLSITRSDQERNVFLLDRIDISTRPLPQLLGIPAFTCVRESFNEKLKVLGGYIATDELSAKATANLIHKIISGEAAEQAKIQDIDKEYIVDWNVLSMHKIYNPDKLPSYVRIINYPFYERYRYELYVLGGIFVIAFIVLVGMLVRTHKRTLIERQNIAVLKKMQEELSRSISGSNITTWRIKGDDLEFDENFIKLTRSPCRKFKFEEFLKYHHPDDISLISRVIEQVGITHQMMIQRVRLRFNEVDSYVWYEVRCSSFSSRLGEVIVAGIVQDVQNVVDREQELIMAKELAEKAELKQSFLTNMSHEIRTPLNAIVGFTNILISEDTSDLEQSEKTEMLSLINLNSELLLKLINDVLDISRLDSNSLEFKMEECDLVPILKEIYYTHKIIINRALDFKFIVDDSAPIMVNIDKMRFTQVISNLLGNANKFTESGAITLKCEVDLQREKVVVSVKDSGKGIDDDHLNAIFDRFYKTDEFAQGTGLGLSICKVIVERLSGHITVQSKLDEGSCFVVTLPLIPK